LPSISKAKLLSNQNSPIYDSESFNNRNLTPGSAGGGSHFPKNVFSFIPRKVPVLGGHSSQKSNESSNPLDE
jgi:hypothetical protein